jgi:hypothetical protein
MLRDASDRDRSQLPTEPGSVGVREARVISIVTVPVYRTAIASRRQTRRPLAREFGLCAPLDRAGHSLASAQGLLGPCVLGPLAEHTFRYAADATASDADFAVVIHSADAGPRRVSGSNTMNGYFRCFLPYPASSERKLRSCGIGQFCSPKNLCQLQMILPVRCASRHGLLGPQFSWLPRLRCLVGVSSRPPAASRRRGSHQRLPRPLPSSRN